VLQWRAAPAGRCHGNATSPSSPAQAAAKLRRLRPSLIEFKGEDPSTGSRLVQLFPVTIVAKHLDIISVRSPLHAGRLHEITTRIRARIGR